MPEQILTQSLVRELLRYYPTSGRFVWRRRTLRHYKGDEPKLAAWNTRWSGIEAGTIRPDGYIIIAVENTLYRAHRLAWFYVYGRWPKEIDHINRNKSDNRLMNLRVVTRSRNNLNSGLRKDNKSGIKGVCYHRARSKWMARLNVDGEAYFLGYFDNLDSAVSARTKAERELAR